MTRIFYISHVSVISMAVIAFSGLCVSPVENARILAVETIGGKSHWNFMSAVLLSLTDAGHGVTVFTPFLDGQRVNYTEVDTSKTFELVLNTTMEYLPGDIGKPNPSG